MRGCSLCVLTVAPLAPMARKGQGGRQPGETQNHHIALLGRSRPHRRVRHDALLPGALTQRAGGPVHLPGGRDVYLDLDRIAYPPTGGAPSVGSPRSWFWAQGPRRRRVVRREPDQRTRSPGPARERLLLL